MEKLEQYRHYVKQVITEYSQIGSSKDPIEQQLIFDTVGDHYQLMYVGWKNRRRYHGCVLHLDIKKGKIWIQHDGTEVGIANELNIQGLRWVNQRGRMQFAPTIILLRQW